VLTNGGIPGIIIQTTTFNQKPKNIFSGVRTWEKK
jgi:hypothetical protein